MLKKRGQITVFIIIGMVLLFSFGFLFFASNMLKESKIKSDTRESVSESFRSDTFKEYSSGCLKSVSREAILLIGKQGGNIYTSQGGIISLEKFIPVEDEAETYNVSYGIRYLPEDPDYTLGGVAFYPPQYPIGTDDFNRDLYLGNHYLPFLCDPNGPNAVLDSATTPFRTTCKMPGGSFTKSGYGENSIQEQLSKYIANELKDCIDFSDLEGLSGEVIDQGQYRVNVTLGDDDISIFAEVPLTIKIGDKTLHERARFNEKIDVRLKKIYTMAHMLIESEKRNLFFNKTDDKDLKSALKEKWIEDVTIDITRPFSNYETYYDDLITITDTTTSIFGNPFVFRFAIDNRFPALSLGYEPIFNPYKETYDIVVASGQTITFNPKGYDPDEDKVLYSYFGWMEDYFTTFNPTCCQPSGTVDCRINHEECIEEELGDPHGWTTSLDYRTTERRASYDTALRDIGLHIVRVNVSDARTSDWKDVRIFVVDTPSAIANGSSNYSDITTTHASIEDPYFLNASSSVSLLLPIGKYIWDDPIEPFNLEGGPILRLPKESFDIQNIKEKIFTKVGEHEITLKVSNLIAQGEQELTVQVEECLPHRYDNRAPWPYNSISFDGYNDIADPFKADHTCCKDDYTYEPKTTECYQYNEYASYGFFENMPYISNMPGSGSGEITQTMVAFHAGNNNDVFRRTFRRNCTGDRGNTCEGTKTLEVTFVQACNDICQIPGNFINEQQGPAYNNPISCQNVGTNYHVEFDGAHGYDRVSGLCDPVYRPINGEVECQKACGSSCNQNVNCRCIDPSDCISGTSCYDNGEEIWSNCRKCVSTGNGIGNLVSIPDSTHCYNSRTDPGCGEQNVDCGGGGCAACCGQIGGTYCNHAGSTCTIGSPTPLGQTPDCQMCCGP